jgi:hypothetical protein
LFAEETFMHACAPPEMKRSRIVTDVAQVVDRPLPWYFESERETDQRGMKAPPSVAVRRSNPATKHVEENLVGLAPPWLSRKSQKREKMELIYPRCCGVDIHKKTIVACVITVGDNGERQKEIRTFRTVTGELLAFQDWLTTTGCTHVAMESTGVYWKPVYNLLEGHFELLVVNAQHIKAVPGRKVRREVA